MQKRGTADTISTRFVINKNNVFVGAYGDGDRPKLTTTYTESGDRSLFEISGQNFFIRDIEIAAPNLASSIKPNGPNGVIYNVDISESRWGIRGYASGSGLSIYCSTIQDIGEDGIYFISLSNLDIGYNAIYNVNSKFHDEDFNNYPECANRENSCDDNFPGDGIQFDSVTYFRVHHNVIDKSDNTFKFNFIAKFDTASAPPSDFFGIFEYNTVYLPQHGPDGGTGVYLDAEIAGVTIRYNTFMGPGPRAIYNHSPDTQIYGNIFVGGTGVDIQTGAPAESSAIYNTGSNVAIYNNVFHQYHEDLLTGGGFYLYNNILSACEGAVLHSGSHRDNNLFTYSGADMKNGEFEGNADFVDAASNDFHLGPLSDAIDAGIENSFIQINSDREGKPFVNQLDLGPFEFQY